MISISVSLVLAALKFLGVWAISYGILLMARFGSNINWKTEIVAVLVALLPPVFLFTDIFKFVP